MIPQLIGLAALGSSLAAASNADRKRAAAMVALGHWRRLLEGNHLDVLSTYVALRLARLIQDPRPELYLPYEVFSVGKSPARASASFKSRPYDVWISHELHDRSRGTGALHGAVDEENVGPWTSLIFPQYHATPYLNDDLFKGCDEEGRRVVQDGKLAPWAHDWLRIWTKVVLEKLYLEHERREAFRGLHRRMIAHSEVSVSPTMPMATIKEMSRAI